MIINISETPEELGRRAAALIAKLINEAISSNGYARIVLSTGKSQFETLDHLVQENVDWSKVEMFHLDEYVGIDENHPASFRKYLKERFVSRVNPGKVYFVTEEESIPALAENLREKPVDVGVIGIGENGHIAFNDPPADFDTDEAYKVVTLDSRCRSQQVGEGWFRSINEVPEKAITMCVKEIMKARHIVSAVPHSTKAEAVWRTITTPLTPEVPATVLKSHEDWNLFLDQESASMLLGSRANS